MAPGEGAAEDVAEEGLVDDREEGVVPDDDGEDGLVAEREEVRDPVYILSD